MLDYPHRLGLENAKKILEHVDPTTGLRKYAVNRPINLKDPADLQAKEIRVTQSYLRSEVELKPSLTNYTFPVLTNDTPLVAFDTEVRLKAQDVFFCYGFGFYLLCARTGGGDTQFASQLMTFPNPNFLGSAGLNLNLMTGLWTIPYMTVTMNNNVITPNWPILKHYKINQTQIDTMIWPNGPYFNQQDLNDDGIQVVEPNWIIQGSNNNKFELIYPKSLLNIGIGDSAQFRFVAMMYGFLAQNCSGWMDPK